MNTDTISRHHGSTQASAVRQGSRPQLTFRASVALEYDSRPPQTVRAEIRVPNARLGARRAAELAFRRHPGACWRSMVIVLEKLDQAAQD